MKLTAAVIYALFTAVLLSCNSRKGKTPATDADTEKLLLSSERKWLEYEFALDTASIAPMLHNDFISISPEDTSNKQMELEGVYKNISAMRSDSVFIDSFKIEEPFIVKRFDNTAITIFICHTYKTAKGKHQEKRTKFYDVWRRVNGEWKAMSSLATVVEEMK